MAPDPAILLDSGVSRLCARFPNKATQELVNLVSDCNSCSIQRGVLVGGADEQLCRISVPANGFRIRGGRGTNRAAWLGSSMSVRLAYNTF